MERLIRAASVAALACLVLSIVSCSNDDSSLVGPSPLAVTSSFSTTAAAQAATVSPLSVRVEWAVVTPPGIVAGNNQQSYEFTAVVRGGAEPYTFKWNFADGSPQVGGNPVTHQFHRPGTYNVVVTVTDARGAKVRSDSAGDLEIEITAAPFSVACHVDPTQGEAPLAVSFRAEPTGNVGPITWKWDFGDGESASRRIASHTYNPAPRRPAPATFVWIPRVQTTRFQATATATDGIGRSVQCSQEIVVTTTDTCPVAVKGIGCRIR